MLSKEPAGKHGEEEESASGGAGSGGAGTGPDNRPGFSIWGRMDAEDESLLPTLRRLSDENLRAGNGHARGKVRETLDSTTAGPRDPPTRTGHDGRDGREASPGSSASSLQTAAAAAARHPPSECRLSALPSEIIDHILSFLLAADLLAFSATCRLLRLHAVSDHLWQVLVQSHVPGSRVATPYPCDTFRELYAAHDPRWFLTEHKIWFCDRDLAGKLIVARYDQRRGCIEGYQLLANSNRTTYQHWAADAGVIIHSFEPQVKLHLDKPVLQLRALSLEPSAASSSSASLGPVSGGGGASSSRFMAETPMPLDDRATDTMFCNFMLARPLPDAVADQCWTLPFLYGNIWPPPAVPSRHRVSAASPYQHREAGADPLLLVEDRPTCRAELSDRAFRVRSWMEMRTPGAPRGVGFSALAAAHLEGEREAAGEGSNSSAVRGQATRSRRSPPGYLRAAGPAVGVRIGEEVTTYATLDPALYTPTRDKPWRGIWVGDYSAHGCEFLLINQVHPEDEEDGPSQGGLHNQQQQQQQQEVVRREDETDEEFERRAEEARVYRGRLEAIKLTGDPNVPRGEYTFVAEDLGEGGFVANVEEEPFKGARVVKSKGHVAGTGFHNDRYIESQLLFISPDRLAQYWVGFGHISFFERVDIDRFLVPD